MKNLTPKNRYFFSAREALKLLSFRDKWILIFSVFIQIFLSVLDLLGVVAIGALGALSIQGIESHGPGNKVNIFLKMIHIQKLSFQNQVALLGAFASAILIVKTLTSVYVTRKIFYFLSRKSNEISANLIEQILYQDLVHIQVRTTQQILVSVSDGVKNLTIGVLATIVNMVADVAMLIIMSVGLIVIDPMIALSTVGLFLLTGFALYRILHVRAHKIGVQIVNITIENNQKILEALNTYREIVVRARQSFYIDQVRSLGRQLSALNAERTFQPYIGKYLIESVSVLGALSLAAFEFSTKNAVHAVATLAVFVTASTRIAPAALRIQQGALEIKSSSGLAESTLQLIAELGDVEEYDEEDRTPTFNYDDFTPNVFFNSVGFSYPGLNNFRLNDIDLAIKSGTSVAIVGPSGAGKTTLVDLLLGVLKPDEGSILIDRFDPQTASRLWTGGIGYVPQSIFITPGTIRENVGLGYPKPFLTDERIWGALAVAQLDKVVEALELKLDSNIGENGLSLSGGERQRLGIARAIFTSPKLLILDEATSALDGQTEEDLSTEIKKLSGKTTVVIVAHRLSTIRSVDQLIYMDKGKILAMGSIQDVKSAVPNFAKQARLMGL